MFALIFCLFVTRVLVGGSSIEDDFDLCSSTSPPVCGKNVDGLLETFTNECTFNETISEYPLEQWQMVELSDCTQKRVSEQSTCDTVKCHHQYLPICLNYTTQAAKEYVFFPSPCDFQIALCKNKLTEDYTYVDPIYCQTLKCKQSLCEDRVRSGDIKVYKVCARMGSEHKIFENHCDLEKEQCEGAKWKVTANRICFTK